MNWLLEDRYCIFLLDETSNLPLRIASFHAFPEANLFNILQCRWRGASTCAKAGVKPPLYPVSPLQQILCEKNYFRLLFFLRSSLFCIALIAAFFDAATSALAGCRHAEKRDGSSLCISKYMDDKYDFTWVFI